MIKCCDDCIPCCDFCIHAIHETFINKNNEEIVSGPIKCNLHTDQKYQDIAESDGCCEDFHCFLTNNE